MFPPLLPLATKVGVIVLSFLKAHALTAASGVGNKALSQLADQIFGRVKLDRDVAKAVHKAYGQFKREVHDPNLVRALNQNKRFVQSNEVAAILANVATSPDREEQQVTDLTRQIQATAPEISHQRCEDAANVLIRCVHTEALKIKELQMLLLIFELRPKPQPLGQIRPYEPGLREDLVRAATAVAAEVGQRAVVSAHLLYALCLQPPTTTASRVLEESQITAPKVKAILPQLHMPEMDAEAGGLTSGAKSALVEAQVVAQRAYAEYTEGIHVLEVLVQRVIQGGKGSETLTYVFDRLGYPRDRMNALQDQIRNGTQLESARQILSH
jgi:hypothetical protein